MVFSVLNMLLFSVLFVYYVRSLKRSTAFIKLLTKVKTSILALIILLEASVFARYTFNFEKSATYDTLLICSNFLQSIILF